VQQNPLRKAGTVFGRGRLTAGREPRYTTSQIMFTPYLT
jgi:hypothetical protein